MPSLFNQTICDQKNIINIIFTLSSVFLIAFCTLPVNANSEDLRESSLSMDLNPTFLTTVQSIQNAVLVQQIGFKNKANVMQQNGGDNTVNLIQVGINNLADIEQTGVNNSVNLFQQGNNNLAQLIQEGDGNIINLTQLGEQSLSILQQGNGMLLNISVAK